MWLNIIMKNFKKVFRLLALALLLLLAAASAGLGAIALRRPEQDYDNEIKTEIVEGQEDNLEMNDRN
jgi:hypothetical protein